MSPNENTYSEKDLFLLIAEGDEKAFRQLFDLYARLLFPFLFKIVRAGAVAEELIQEVMLRVWLHREQLPTIDHPRQWIFRIASNLAFTALQRKLVEGRVIDELNKGGEPQISQENELPLKELKHHIQQAVRQLPKERRRIYQLSREAGLSREEIATQLGISPSTVKNAIVSALKSIREYLEQAGYFLLWLYLLLIKM